MYIGASDLCNRIVIAMDQDLQYTRLWDIKEEFSPLIRSRSIQILDAYSVLISLISGAEL